ncbi:MAG: hypothetical protein M3R39_04810 [Actinomycetota bacterium]|nr:hypothetical protein [Actinomycetota bacterium]
MALVMAIGIMTVLAISGTTVTYYATENSGHANRAKGKQSAYALAEAGINSALSVLASSFQPATSTALPTCPTTSTAASVEGGSYVYCGTLVGTIWTISSTGTIKNPATAKGNLNWTLTRSVSIYGLNNGSSLAAWSRIYNDDTTACFTIPAGVKIPSNVGARGNLCLVGSEITGSTTEVAVGGNVTLTSGSSNSIRAAGAGTGWTNSGNILASDNAKATVTLAAGVTSANLDATSFGFSIPANATIAGITAKVERAAGGINLIKDNSVTLLKGGTSVSSNKAGSSFWDTIDTNITYGTSTDLWGTTWTVADINGANFGLRFSAKNFGASSTTADVDYVELTVYYSIGPNIGTSGTPVSKADIAGTCKLNAAAAHTPCSSADNVYAGAITTTPTGLQKPSVDFAYWYDNAAPGPKHGCDVFSGTPPSFDSNTTYDGSLADQWIAPDGGGNSSNNPAGTSGGTTPTTPSYTCQAKNAQNNVIGELSWNNATRVLTVKGTIFFDGQILLHNHNGFVVHYQGRATIYASKGWHNDEAFCAGGSGLTTCRNASTISSWDPVQNLLVLILGDKNAAGTDDCNFHTDYSAFQGVIWAKNNCEIKDTAYSSGPVIASKVLITGTPSFFTWPNLGSLLPGQQYGSTSTSTDFLVQPGNQSG